MALVVPPVGAGEVGSEIGIPEAAPRRGMTLEATRRARAEIRATISVDVDQAQRAPELEPVEAGVVSPRRAEDGLREAAPGRAPAAHPVRSTRTGVGAPVAIDVAHAERSVVRHVAEP